MSRHLLISEKPDIKIQSPFLLEKRNFLGSKTNSPILDNHDLKCKKKLKIEDISDFIKSSNLEVKLNPLANENIQDFINRNILNQEQKDKKKQFPASIEINENVEHSNSP